VDADAAAAQARWVDPGRLALFLDHPPGGLAVQVPPLEAATVWPHGPKERAFPVVPDTGLRHVGAAPHRPAEPEGSGVRPGPELSADARLVQVVGAAVARADYRDDAFPLLKRQQPEWTHDRWDRAVAELNGHQRLGI